MCCFPDPKPVKILSQAAIKSDAKAFPGLKVVTSNHVPGLACSAAKKAQIIRSSQITTHRDPRDPRDPCMFFYAIIDDIFL